MLLDGADAVWARVRSDHRKAMRKAENRGVTVREARGAADYAAFYDVYVRVFRDFGTPPYAGRYFRALWQRLHGDGAVRLLLAHAAGRCVGGLVLYCFRQRLVSKFAAVLPEGVALRAYAALYGRAIELGLEGGYTHLSWGTSSRDQTGLLEFKERWGSTHREAAVYDLGVAGKAPDLERYYDSAGITRRVWSRLPLPVTRWLGGPINRWFC